MTIRDFVSNGRHSHRTEPNTNLKKTIAIHHYSNFVNNEGFRIFANDNDGPIATNFATRVIRGLVDSADEDVVILDASAFGWQSIFIYF